MKSNEEYNLASYEQADSELMVEKLQEVGIYVSVRNVYKAWSAYSEALCAGWLIMPKTVEGFLGNLKSEGIELGHEK